VLADNGGPTQTHALKPGSPAIDQGDPFACSVIAITDQRGFRRPIGPDCDIGAFEFGPKIVNNLFSRPVISNERTALGDIAGCPSDFVGKFTFDARFRKIRSLQGSELITDPFVLEVATLTNGNLLQDTDVGLGGIGARLLVPREDGFADGVLSQAEFIDVPFEICLKSRDKFNFFVDLLGKNQ
jgi:hypothetical protein